MTQFSTVAGFGQTSFIQRAAQEVRDAQFIRPMGEVSPVETARLDFEHAEQIAPLAI